MNAFNVPAGGGNKSQFDFVGACLIWPTSPTVPHSAICPATESHTTGCLHSAGSSANRSFARLLISTAWTSVINFAATDLGNSTLINAVN